ncbi:hypothetical protein BYT27DRAFT_7212614 [Phlegmacium glaucopus]|nr:hypothetical protein BYT27DRAFT_7212614 [Phlegmacium glaucopus]
MRQSPSASSQFLIDFKQDPLWNPGPMHDWLASLPSNEYTVIYRNGSPFRSNWFLALRFKTPTEITLPVEMDADDIRSMPYDEDVFHRIRDYGVPTGTHVYKLISLLRVPHDLFLPITKYSPTSSPSYRTYGRILAIAETSKSEDDFIVQIQTEAPEYSIVYKHEILDIAEKIYQRDSQITET